MWSNKFPIIKFKIDWNAVCIGAIIFLAACQAIEIMAWLTIHVSIGFKP